MGALFSEHVVGVRRPRVALLSIGEERGKGDARVQEATELLGATDLRFMGNVEGKDLTADMADVVVCDAILGNVVIKFFEGLSGFIFDLLRGEFRRNLRGRVAYLLLRPGIARIRKNFDYEIVGGSPLLGVKGAVIITHGRAKRRMIEHAVRVGATTARERVPELIAEAIAADAAAKPRPGAVGRARLRARPRAGPPDARAVVGTGVIRDTVRLATLEVPGVLRVGRGGPAWRDALGGPPSMSGSATAASTSPSGSSRARASDSSRSPPRSGRRSPPPSSGCSAWSSAGSPSWSMAPGPDGPAPGAATRTSSGPPRRSPAGARGRVRGRVRPADAGCHPRAPPRRAEGDAEAAELARELVANVVAP